MIKIFTKNDLVRYIYNETSKTENELIQVLLITDPKFKNTYLELLETKSGIDNYEATPSSTVIDKILSYSKHSKSTDLHSV